MLILLAYIWQGAITFRFEVDAELAVVDIDVRITASEIKALVSGSRDFIISVCHHRNLLKPAVGDLDRYFS